MRYKNFIEPEGSAHLKVYKNNRREEINMIKVIMDCDPGHDDAIALLLASRSENIKILGVTTVAGNSELENTT